MSDSSLLSSIRSSFGSTSAMPSSGTPIASVPVQPVEPPIEPAIDAPRKRLIIPPSLLAKMYPQSQATDAPMSDTDEQLEVIGRVFDELEAEKASIEPAVTPTPEPVAASVPPEQPLPTQPVADVVGPLAQAVPQVTLQTTDTLNPSTPTATYKEVASRSALDSVGIDAGTGLQLVEQEKTPELPPEVESFLQHVEDHQDQLPQEIVIADGSISAPTTTHHPSQPVLVLPITPEIEKQGKHKSAGWSIRWLVEWSEKIIKMFTGQVIYREASE